ncbi:MAG: universal stress protein [Halobacteriota archaeon]|jgi:nucleotide-binding universal stress UspA family protein
MEYEKILIGTDGGDLMAPVYDHAAYFARLTDATVHIAYVLDIAGFTAYPIDSSWENMYDVLLDEGKQIVANAKRDLASRGVNEDRIVTTVLDGHPAEEIDKYAGSQDIDLVVIGSHGRKGLDRLLIGSVADKVVRGSRVPVLIVRSR